MYKTSVPIALESIRNDRADIDLQQYLNYFVQGEIKRVFISLCSGVYTKQFVNEISSYKFKHTVDFFKSNGMEVGIWIGGFGHGSALLHDTSDEMRNNYQRLTGVMGENFAHGYCPLDAQFREDYLASIRELAKLNPDIIMIDDDYRLISHRRYHMGCFCPNHLKEYYKLIGEEIPREKIEKLILTGQKNKYRNAYLSMLRKTLMDFAEYIRTEIDNINPNIRLGVAAVPELWDSAGTDMIELSHAFAGKTAPFLRTFGAPYHNQYDIIPQIEQERMQTAWVKSSNKNIEIITEGDTYPRPRYNTNAKSLELFDLALNCDNVSDGILKYLFNYEQKLGFETGYIEKHIKELERRKHIAKLFENKRSVGISAFNEIHLIQNWDISPEHDVYNMDNVLRKSYEKIPDAFKIFSKNSIPTSYFENEYPVSIFGENARYISFERLKNGVILDSSAAKILKERGIDVGLLHSETLKHCNGEYFDFADDIIRNLSGCVLEKFQINKKATCLSVFAPDNSPASYIYENDDGIRFLVFACDFMFSKHNPNYFNNYYRQEQLITALEWVGRKKLPVVCTKHPNLYVLASKDSFSMSVLLINIFPDEIHTPAVTLDAVYSSVHFENCSGIMEGNQIQLSDIPSYGYAAFEIFI